MEKGGEEIKFEACFFVLSHGNLKCGSCLVVSLVTAAIEEFVVLVRCSVVG